jgi:RimJ/RimL family protein N-acetyltransferase
VTVHDDILSNRLILRLISAAALRATVEGDVAAVARLTGLGVPAGWREIAPLAKRRLLQLELDPDYLPWSIRAIAVRETKDVVGYGNFHAAPGAEDLKAYAPRAVELGYTVLGAYRRQGFGSEAVRMLIDWAKARGADAFVFSVSPRNIASRALIARLGAVKVGSHIDEEDGLEDIYLVKR